MGCLAPYVGCLVAWRRNANAKVRGADATFSWGDNGTSGTPARQFPKIYIIHAAGLQLIPTFPKSQNTSHIQLLILPHIQIISSSLVNERLKTSSHTTMSLTTVADRIWPSWGRTGLYCLAGIGSIWTARRLQDLTSFVYFHFIRKSSLHRLKAADTSGPPWALITGASDGIGKGFAQELCDEGFNVILHGRNEQKLHAVREDLLAQFPQRSVEIFILDAATIATAHAGLEDLLQKRFGHYNLRLLVNNVATTSHPLFESLTNRSAQEIALGIEGSAHFPAQITRAVLPQLHRHQPAAILNIGSGVSELPAPYLTFYSAAKAYNKIFSANLAAELQAEDGWGGVEVLALLVGMVATNTPAVREASFLVPSARRFARCCLGTVGCGRRVVWPYWPHTVQFGGMMGMLPGWVLERAVLGIVAEERAKDGMGGKG